MMKNMDGDSVLSLSNISSKEDFAIGRSLFNKNKTIIWNPQKVANPHLCIVGASGTGKTTLLKSVIRYLAQKYAVFVLDFHGDIEVKGEEYIKFKSTSSEYGISLFEFDTDPEEGGVLARVLEIIQTFKKTFMPKMGPMQEAVLKQLLIDTYAIKNIDYKDPSTWNNSELPTLEDMYALVQKIEKYLNGSIDKELTEILFKANKLYRKNRELMDEKYEEKIVKLREKAIQALELFFNRLMNNEDAIESSLQKTDIEFYKNKNAFRTLESIKLYLRDMIKSGVFSQNNPVIKKRLVRFDMSPLNEQIQIFLSDVIIQRIFRKSKKSKNLNKGIKAFIVIDESKLILPYGKEKENPFNYINRIVSESRKYGLGIILASQRIAHYSEEMLSNIDTKIVLRINENDIAMAKSKLGIKDSVYYRHLSSRFGVAIVKKGNELESVLLHNK